MTKVLDKNGIPMHIGKGQRKWESMQAEIYRGRTCHYCGCKITYRNRSADHLVPVSRGGSNSLSNLVLACKTCNQGKANLLPEEWADAGYPGKNKQGATK